ncbi:hypothetical protein BGZ61DRAFT_45415 [Ilyonectria robusta]|uniref:uncharacterized protein n=1 Tax=Ilyonectria robusta TaxID=1079257 RepID=UPI001E8E47F6|nr:uncharacterized protein BGZ61DRAFT_45415 [Ilyonectria robusta]KAH8686770.1 hypothetical protein BGZ61DRAFT_45415 [Ilyonectria robusta]
MPSLLLGPIAAAVVRDWHHLVDACSSERVCQPSLKPAGQQGPCLPEEALSPVNLACMIPAYRYSRCCVDRGQTAARGNKQIFVGPVKSTAAEERLNPMTWGETADNTTKPRWLLPVKTLSRIQSRLLLWAGLPVNWTPTYRLRCWCVCVCACVCVKFSYSTSPPPHIPSSIIPNPVSDDGLSTHTPHIAQRRL